MDDKKKPLVAIGCGVVVTLGLGGLLFAQHRSLEQMRAEAVDLEQEIATNRALVAKTPDLERQVILQRETDETVRTILPAAKEMPNFSRALHQFASDAGVRISSLQEKNSSKTRGQKTDFEKAAYTIKFEGDAFQILSFFNLAETYERFMAIPAFQLTASKPKKASRETDPDAVAEPQRHTVTLEIETYVYDEKGTPDRVEIEGYERKRDLLAADIAQRRQALVVVPYQYRGPRNRRDPWIDPRMLVTDNQEAPMPIDEQITLVEGLVEQVVAAQVGWESLQVASTVIAEMKVRTDLEGKLAAIEAEIRRVQTENALSFPPARRRFEVDVVDAVEAIRDGIALIDGKMPSIPLLEETVNVMRQHLERAEYDLALQAHEAISSRMAFVQPDDGLRQPFVEQIEHYAKLARTVLDFNQLALVIEGVTIYGNRAIAVINGKAYAIHDMVGPDLQILSITTERVEFLFRGVVVHQPIQGS